MPNTETEFETCDICQRRVPGVTLRSDGTPSGESDYMCPQCRTGERDELRDLLAEVADYMQENEIAAPSLTWWRRYYLTTGDHMICTPAGWETGAVKDTYDADEIIDEVNCPANTR